MKMSEGGSFPSLDTCRCIEGGGLIYSMSLLAFCGFHGREAMMDLLLKNGAGNSAVMLINMSLLYMQNTCSQWSGTKFLTEPIRT